MIPLRMPRNNQTDNVNSIKICKSRDFPAFAVYMLIERNPTQARLRYLCEDLSNLHFQRIS
jgi:hypothetical protein